METHEVQTVVIEDTVVFKGEEVFFGARYQYCAEADEYLETEAMIKANQLAMKDAYRKKVGLLTSKQIVAIRNKYCVSQKDFSNILDWGGSTITRYENHQVQDRAHDDVLRKIDSDPKWFLQMLMRAKENISDKAYEKYYKAASAEFNKVENNYLIDAIQALYANFYDDVITGGVTLNLDKVIEVINYYALKVASLHKVKLMKMLWYADSLSYKQRGKAITGLVYKSLPMGAVPEGYQQILDLDGIQFEEVIYDSGLVGYKFYPVERFQIKKLSDDETEILDTVIELVGQLNTKEIVDKMHSEAAYKCTSRNCIVSFSHAENLSI